MTSKRKSFVLHIDSLEILDDLTNDQAGVLFKAIKAYQNDDEFNLESIVKMVFIPFKNQFIRDNEKYTKTCERRAVAGSKGGKQKVANASKCLQKVANVADSVSKNKSDSKSDSDSDSKVIKKTSRFTPPSLEDVKQYCNERMNHVNADDFIDHYTAANWFRGKTKIKDWKACVRTWEKNAKPKSQTIKQFSDITEQNINTIGDWLND